MNFLLVDGAPFMDHEINRLIRTQSLQFQRTEDRAFQIGGHYPLSLSSVGPVSFKCQFHQISSFHSNL